jgi:hypothetical protein
MMIQVVYQQLTFPRVPRPVLPTRYYTVRDGQQFFLHEFIDPVAYCIQVTVPPPEAGLSDIDLLRTLYNAGPMQFEYMLDADQFGVEEYFQFNWEIAKRKKGDCEDSANFFTSQCIAAGFPAATVYGYVIIDGQPYGHAWTEIAGIVFDTTVGEFIPVPRPPEYRPQLAVSPTTYVVMQMSDWIAFNIKADAQIAQEPRQLKKVPPNDALEKLKKILKKEQ